ncbi:MAG: hypothetical protein VKM98_07530 [Cyanobacteriota bacterium]|nr:hypothetical protein [Cyanobacteriota bacterium]
MVADTAQPAGIRLLHHWACSGGTLLSRCLAAHPTVVLLSEVHPLAYLRVSTPHPYYAPTDLIQQLSLPHNGRDPVLCLAAFNGAIEALDQQLSAEGRTLVLRSHSHVDFFSGVLPADAPLLSTSLSARHQLHQLLSVRHPLDSWLSLCQQGWQKQFCFSSLAEFCRRALAMLSACNGMALVRYEDFCLAPDQGLTLMAEALQLPLQPDLQGQLADIQISGDSGRRDSSIGVRPRRPIPHQLAWELSSLMDAAESPYLQLCDQLGYNPDPSAAHPFTTTPAPWHH